MTLLSLFVSLFLSLHSGIPLLCFLVLLPLNIPWSQISVTWLGVVHFLACLSPQLGSVVYHLFMNHEGGEPVYKTLLTLDMCGICMINNARVSISKLVSDVSERSITLSLSILFNSVSDFPPLLIQVFVFYCGHPRHLIFLYRVFIPDEVTRWSDLSSQSCLAVITKTGWCALETCVTAAQHL